MNGMKWDEFSDLLVGVSPDTPLGRIVAIRSENDREELKNFSREQHRIRNEWRNKRIKKQATVNEAEMLEQLKQAFINLAGGGVTSE